MSLAAGCRPLLLTTAMVYLFEPDPSETKVKSVEKAATKNIRSFMESLRRSRLESSKRDRDEPTVITHAPINDIALTINDECDARP